MFLWDSCQLQKMDAENKYSFENLKDIKMVYRIHGERFALNGVNL